MKRVVVTGATGFVGANLARRLLRDGHDVYLLVRPNYTSWRIESIRSKVHLDEVDFVASQALTNIVSRIRPDWIFHLAAYGAYSWQTELPQMVQTNIVGTINLVQACLETGFEAFVNTGSSSEYGFKDHAPAEDEWLEPNSHYAFTKASATLFCRHTAQSKKVHLPTLRLYSVFGPYEDPRRLLPMLILKGLKGILPPLANPDIARDFVYIDDVIEAYLLAAMRPDQELGAVYNVGIGLQVTLRDVVAIARRVLPISIEPIWGSMSDREWDTKVWVADSRKIRESLNWQPNCTFEQGLHLMANWLRDNPEMQQFYENFSR